MYIINEAFNDGLGRAAMHLQQKANKMRQAGNVTADMMARVYEAEAAEIMALCIAPRELETITQEHIDHMAKSNPFLAHIMNATS